MQDAETPQGETQSAEALGTEQLPATGSEQVPESKTDVQTVDSVDPETKTDSPDPAEVERLRKEIQKIEMERNMLRNKQQEEEVERLKEAENYKELYEKTQSELQEIQSQTEAQKAADEARKFRDEVINSYPDVRTQEVAKKLLAKNESAIAWGDVETFDDARAQLIEQLDTIKETVSTDQPDPVVSGNNPAPMSPASLSREEAVQEAAAKRDFTDVLSSIPSVQAQIKAVNTEN